MVTTFRFGDQDIVLVAIYGRIFRIIRPLSTQRRSSPISFGCVVSHTYAEIPLKALPKNWRDLNSCTQLDVCLKLVFDDQFQDVRHSGVSEIVVRETPTDDRRMGNVFVQVPNEAAVGDSCSIPVIQMLFYKKKCNDQGQLEETSNWFLVNINIYSNFEYLSIFLICLITHFKSEYKWRC